LAERLYGVGLRPTYLPELDARLRQGRPLGVGVLELMAEGFAAYEGAPGRVIERLRRDVPVVLHGTALGIADADPLSEPHLDALSRLIERYQPLVVSDHLCFAASRGAASYDLLPFPLTEATLDYVAARVHHVQARLGRPIALENVSTYLAYREDTRSEAQFLGELCARTGCGVLLDLNNLVVNDKNRGVPWAPYLEHIPAHAVWQIHLAGHTVRPDFALDTHIGPVRAEVWALLDVVAPRLGGFVGILEWDQEFPPWSVLEAEVATARARGGERAALDVAETHRAPSWLPSSAPSSLTVPVELEAGNTALHALIRGGTTLPALLARLQAGEPDPLAGRWCASGTLTPTLQALAYAEQYYGKLDAVMRDAYPRLLACLGEDEFVAMCAGYFGPEPAFTGELDDVPAGLAEVLEGAPALAERPYLVDLARLEWALFRERAQGWSAHEARRTPTNPSLVLTALAWDAAALWHGQGAPTGPAHTWVASWWYDGAPRVRVLTDEVRGWLAAGVAGPGAPAWLAELLGPGPVVTA
jgi:uncharacterized protein (UPF0276 family)